MMARYGMLINTKKCIGCYACRTACQRQNDLLPDESFIRFEEREVGKYPNVTVEHIPLQCMHCSGMCSTVTLGYLPTSRSSKRMNDSSGSRSFWRWQAVRQA